MTHVDKSENMMKHFDYLKADVMSRKGFTLVNETTLTLVYVFLLFEYFQN